MANHDETVGIQILSERMENLATIQVSETEWQRINYVDYIPVEPNGRPTAEMYEAHGHIAAEAMQGVAVRALAIARVL